MEKRLNQVFPSPSCEPTASMFQRRQGSREGGVQFCCGDIREALLTKLLFELLILPPYKKASAETASRTSIKYKTATEERISGFNLN